MTEFLHGVVAVGGVIAIVIHLAALIFQRKRRYRSIRTVRLLPPSRSQALEL